MTRAGPARRRDISKTLCWRPSRHRGHAGGNGSRDRPGQMTAHCVLSAKPAAFVQTGLEVLLLALLQEAHRFRIRSARAALAFLHINSDARTMHPKNSIRSKITWTNVDKRGQPRTMDISRTITLSALESGRLLSRSLLQTC